MAWETYEKEYPCPCGQGKRVEIRSDSGWGRSEVDERMDCATCQPAFVRVRVSQALVARGRASPGYRLVSREQWERDRAAAEVYRAAEQEVIDRVLHEHGPSLLRALSNFTSRKDLHRELKRRDFVVFGFESFSRDIRERGRDAVLLELVNRNNFRPLATLLGLPAIGEELEVVKQRLVENAVATAR